MQLASNFELPPAAADYHFVVSADISHRVRTLTGKEIELDIESDYKVHKQTHPTTVSSGLLIDIGVTNKRKGRGERRNSTCTAASDLRGKTNVYLPFLSLPHQGSFTPPYLSNQHYEHYF
jgi:hypothetical protein